MTVPLFRLGPRMVTAFAGGRAWVVFLDLDGTLAPLVCRPSHARVPGRTRRLLRRLGRKVRIAVISGRRASEVRGLVGGQVDWIVGNHGFEIWSREEGRVAHAATRPAGLESARALRGALRGFRGVTVENKRWTLAVHFRAAPAVDPEALYTRVCRAVEPFNMEVGVGKKVLDIKPVGSLNKGRAVIALLEQHHGSRWGDDVAVLYAGDDTTDEDAFRVLEDAGLTIKVGAGDTAARYRTRSPKTLQRWMERLEVWI